MDEIVQEDPLDQQLREAAPYIDDGGFTVRVLRHLPRPWRPGQSLRAVILLGATLLASVLGYVLSDNGRFVRVIIERLATMPMPGVFALALIGGMLLTALGLMAAIAETHES